MQQIDGVRLEKLRGGAQVMEGQVPLILEEQRRRRQSEERKVLGSGTSTSYKDALVSHS